MLLNRVLSLPWILACALAGAGSAASAENAATDNTPTPKAATNNVLADKRINPRTPAAPATAAAVVPKTQDPLERLQERLAERLGARMAAAEAKDGNELRVVSRPVGDAAMVKPVVAGRTAVSSRVAAKGAGAAVSSAKVVSSPYATPTSHWSYEGASGPQAWAGLKPEYAACGKGERQSPIDVRDGIKVQLDAVQFHYQAPDFRVLDDGRTVKVLVGVGSAIEVAGQRYELTHLQFHRPAEVHVNGKVFDMAVHLFHQDGQGRQAVVAVPLQRGSAHPVVQMVWNNLPLEKGVEQAARSPLDLLALLPLDQRYITFMGSMTTPPCQEGVLWVVMKNPVSISEYQEAVFSRLYPMNARPLQALNGRMVKESE
ncbi:MAG: carbonic anhydrase [Burkholderiales bacterium]